MVRRQDSNRDGNRGVVAATGESWRRYGVEPWHRDGVESRRRDGGEPWHRDGVESGRGVETGVETEWCRDGVVWCRDSLLSAVLSAGSRDGRPFGSTVGVVSWRRDCSCGVETVVVASRL